jgi:hypothetical protein
MPRLECRLDDAASRELYRYWAAWRGDRAMPARADIDPAAISRLLPNIMLIDVEPGPRFRYRLLGSDLVERFGRNVTGQYADEILQGAHARFVTHLYGEVCRSKRPAGAESQYIDRDGLRFFCRRLVLPLSDDESRVTQLLGLQVFDYQHEFRAAAHPPKNAFADPDIHDRRLPWASPTEPGAVPDGSGSPDR